MATWIVTGGAGFIGSHIVEELLKTGHTVRVIDNFFSGKKENLEFSKKYKDKLEIITGDIRDLKLLKKIFRGADYVSHQAALRSVPKSFYNPQAYDEVNVKGTLNVLTAAKECKVKRVIYASSSSVYGCGQNLPQRESDLPNPISIYAATKLNAEYYCKVFSVLYGLETVILRYFNVFGPRQSLESQYAAVIPKFIVSFLKKESPPIYGDGHQSRDFTYVSNIVKANLLAVKKNSVKGLVFNIGNRDSYTVIELFNFLKLYFNIKLRPKFEPPRLGDVKHTLADISYANKILGYQPEVDFKQGMTRTIQWFEENLDKL